MSEPKSCIHYMTCDQCFALEAELESERQTSERYKNALEIISEVSIGDFPELDQIVGSEHYEAAWLRCSGIASFALHTTGDKGEL